MPAFVPPAQPDNSGSLIDELIEELGLNDDRIFDGEVYDNGSRMGDDDVNTNATDDAPAVEANLSPTGDDTCNGCELHIDDEQAGGPCVNITSSEFMTKPSDDVMTHVNYQPANSARTK